VLACDDRLEGAGGGAVGRAAGERIDGAGVAVVAGRRAVAVAGLAALDDAVAAGGGAVAVGRVVAPRWAAAVAALARGDGEERAGRGARLRAAREGVGGAGVAVVASGRAGAVAHLAWIDPPVAARRRIGRRLGRRRLTGGQ